MKFAIIGCGRIGYVHGLSIRQIEGAELVAVSDPVAKNAERLAACTGARISDVENILSTPSIDAIIIASPTPTHYDLIKAGCESRKAIFCEKPVDMDAQRIRECMSFVETADIAFMTGFNRRFDKSFAAIKTRIENGEIGDVEILTITSRDPAPPPVDYIKSSGGIFTDMTIHDFDMARFLLGEEPDTIHAVGSCLVDREIGKAGDVDTAAIVMTTASGKLCQISNSRRATYGYDQRIEVHGSKGMIRAGNQLENTVELASASGFSGARAEPFFLERYKDAYLGELTHFIAAVRNGSRPNPTLDDGLQAQLLADAATQSLKTGTALSLRR